MKEFIQNVISILTIETGKEKSDKFVLEKSHEQICFNDDGNSKETDESDWQHEKQRNPRISTEHGTTIDSSFADENVRDSICFNDDADSDEMDESEFDEEEPDDKRISIEQGILTFLKLRSRRCSIITIRIPMTTLIRRIFHQIRLRVHCPISETELIPSLYRALRSCGSSI
jgi:hypothetical protein